MDNFSGFRIGQITYTALVIGFGLAAIYHIAAIISPDSFPASPVPRHFVFVVLNIAGLLVSVRRWIWLWIPFALLTIQQMISHGWRAYQWWTTSNRIDFISLVIFLCMPVLAVLLFNGFKSRWKTKY